MKNCALIIFYDGGGKKCFPPKIYDGLKTTLKIAPILNYWKISGVSSVICTLFNREAELAFYRENETNYITEKTVGFLI